MFDRISYKRAAWNQFKNQLDVPIIASLLLYVAKTLIESIYFLTKTEENTHLVPIFLLVFLIASGICQIISSYIALKMTRTNQKLPLSDIKIAFNDYWQDGILARLWQTLWIFLWSLLFYIPGIIKAVSYSMMMFILVENPGIGVKKALEISKVLTEGHKMDLFLMTLSFFGWIILAAITGGIGMIFLQPYMTLAFANAYNDLKRLAFQDGKLTPADFTVLQDS